MLLLPIKPAVQRLTTTGLKAFPITTIAATARSALGVADHLRGGGGAVLDLTRTRLRLEGLHQYGVVAALLMNAALRLYTSTPKTVTDQETRVDGMAKVVFSVVVAGCVALGSYTSIVFALLGLYSKRALGMGEDEAFLNFFSATRGIRETGFDSFLVMLLCFKASFLLSLFINAKDNPRLRWGVTGLILAVDIFGWYKWSTIMHLASNLLLIRDF